MLPLSFAEFGSRQRQRAPGGTAILLLLISGSAFAKSAQCKLAYAALAEKQAHCLSAPPTEPLRFLMKDDVKITPISGGKVFRHRYSEEFGLVNHSGPRLVPGVELAFKSATAEIHELKIIGKSTRPGQIEAVTDMVLKLPIETLEATKLIKVQTFVQNTGINGDAISTGSVLLKNGATPRTLTHEFGHNLAVYIWGRHNLFNEWEQAFKADDARFVPSYAKYGVAGSKFAEDFAEAVENHVRDADEFRKSFPNRAARLDTSFRDGNL